MFLPINLHLRSFHGLLNVPNLERSLQHRGLWGTFPVSNYSPGTMIGDSDPRVHLSASCESLHCPQGDGDGDPDHRSQSQQVQSSQKGKEGWVGSIDKALAEQAGGLESGTQHPPKCWVGMGAICKPQCTGGRDRILRQAGC